MDVLERELEARLTRAVRARGGLCLKWVSPGASGVPDRIVLLPGGQVVFVELKRPRGGRVSALQRYWARELTRLGFACCLARTEADVAQLVGAADHLTRRKDE